MIKYCIINIVSSFESAKSNNKYFKKGVRKIIEKWTIITEMNYQLVFEII